MTGAPTRGDQDVSIDRRLLFVSAAAATGDSLRTFTSSLHERAPPVAEESQRIRAVEPKRILCIEDDRETAALIVEELADRDFTAFATYNGHEGFVAILKETPDLVLCDINMPVMTGFEVLERLTELAPRLGRIPFIFLTAMSAREDELRGRRLGADDYITKPIDFDRLHMIINARLAGVARNEVWPKLVMLNDREIDALTWVARGKTSAQIAEILDLSKRTIDFHLDNARVKLGAATRTQAAIKAAVGRLIEP
jgi:DNA-binding NarL/FixJ family response regulator